VFVVRVPWAEVLRSTVWPQPEWNKDYLTTIVAVFGTTISPYLFFWQASQEVEELRSDADAQPLRRAPGQVDAQFRRIRFDTMVGMGVSNLVAFFIMLTTAATLHAHGGVDLQSSAQAASALKPVAGELAFVLFAAGIVGTGLLAIPVLAGSAAYAMAGTFHWKSSLDNKFSAARKFYAIIIVATLAGVGINFVPDRSDQGAVLERGAERRDRRAGHGDHDGGGVQHQIMGTLKISGRLRVLGWLCTGVMLVAVLAMFGAAFVH
jgi:Mn2+/Fe2+ NRAMP family transporter